MAEEPARTRLDDKMVEMRSDSLLTLLRERLNLIVRRL